jgi:hypothetical protein
LGVVGLELNILNFGIDGNLGCAQCAEDQPRHQNNRFKHKEIHKVKLSMALPYYARYVKQKLKQDG